MEFTVYYTFLVKIVIFITFLDLQLSTESTFIPDEENIPDRPTTPQERRSLNHDHHYYSSPRGLKEDVLECGRDYTEVWRSQIFKNKSSSACGKKCPL